MNDNKLCFISNNVKGIQANDKRIKLFEYLRNTSYLMALFSCKRHIPPKTMKNSGKMNLKDNSFFLMEKVIPVVLP